MKSHKSLNTNLNSLIKISENLQVPIMTDVQLALIADPGQNLPHTSQCEMPNPSKYRRSRIHKHLHHTNYT